MPGNVGGTVPLDVPGTRAAPGGAGRPIRPILFRDGTARTWPPRELAPTRADCLGCHASSPERPGPGTRSTSGAKTASRGLGPIERLPLAYGLGTTGLGSDHPHAREARSARSLADASVSERLMPRKSHSRSADRRRTIASRRARFAPTARATASGMPVLIGLGVAAVGPFLLMMALGAMLPTIDFDAIEYHLQGPRNTFRPVASSSCPTTSTRACRSVWRCFHLLGMEVLADWWQGAIGRAVADRRVMLLPPAALIALTAGRVGIASCRRDRRGRLPHDPLDLPTRGLALCRRGPLATITRRIVWATHMCLVDRRPQEPDPSLDRDWERSPGGRWPASIRA